MAFVYQGDPELDSKSKKGALNKQSFNIVIVFTLDQLLTIRKM